MSTVASVSRSAASILRRGLSAPAWAVAVVMLSVAAWLGVLVLMHGMDEGPGTPLHGLPIFLIGWVVMLTAMMLPSELNYIGVLAALLKSRDMTSVARSRLMTGFIAGYGIAWIVYGLAAYILDSLVREIDPKVIDWRHAAPILAGSVLIVAGVYQVSSLKHVCLTGCRSPLSFFARYWRSGDVGAALMGARHGAVCVGCCWALMAVMFAVGAMSLTWMALLTLFMFAEKVLPHGRVLAIPIAGFLWVMGSWIALSPETAPFFEYPGISAAAVHHHQGH